MVEKKKLPKRKDIRPDVPRYVPQGQCIIDFANLCGKLVVTADSPSEVAELVKYLASIPCVADFLGIVKKDNKGEGKKPGVS